MLIKMIFAVDIMGESNCFLDHAYICDPRMPKYKKLFYLEKVDLAEPEAGVTLVYPKMQKLDIMRNILLYISSNRTTSLTYNRSWVTVAD